MSFSVQAARPVALDSPDHLHPFGTAHDNYFNRAFNAKLYQLVSKDRLSVLDIGCAGGGFVKSLLDEGVPAVGIEGSDYSFVHQRAEWATIPGNLFTADATRWFQVLQDGAITRFPVVTAWEFLEHIAESDLAAVLNNIHWALESNGLFIASITTVSSPTPDGFEVHQTIQDQAWWTRKLLDLGWARQSALENYFGQDVVRGGPTSFLVVLKRA